MYACIYSFEDNTLSVVGERSKRLELLGEFKKRESVKLKWGKETYTGTIVKIGEDEDDLTNYATKAYTKFLKNLTETLSEVPEELYTFDHKKKITGKRQPVKTQKIKESLLQDQDFSPKKKKKTSENAKPKEVHIPASETAEKGNVNLAKDVGNTTKKPSKESIQKNIVNKTSLAIMNEMVKDCDLVNQFQEPCVSNNSENEPERDVHKAPNADSSNLLPLTSAWSIYTSEMDNAQSSDAQPADDQPSDAQPSNNEFNPHLPAPPAAILELFEIVCKEEVQSYMKMFLNHYKTKTPNSKTYYRNEPTYVQSPITDMCGKSSQNSNYMHTQHDNSQNLALPSHQSSQFIQLEHPAQQTHFTQDQSNVTPEKERPVPEHTLHFTPPRFSPFTPQQTSNLAPQNSLLFTPQETTHFTPQNASNYTPQQTSHFTPQQTLHFTPQQTNFTPQQMSHFTPQQTSNFTPQQTAHFTPQQTSHFTPQQTSHLTPQQTSFNIPQNSNSTCSTPLRRSPRKHTPPRKTLQAADDSEKSENDDRVKLLASSDITVSRKHLRMATSSAAKAKDNKAAFTLTSKLLPCLFTVQEMAASRGQGLRTKKEGDTRLPLDASRIEVLRDYVTAWCLKNGKGSVRDQDINDAITEKISYCRKKVKKQIE